EARGLDRLGGKAEWHTRSDGAGYGGNGSAISGHERAGHAVEGARPIDVVLNDLDAADISCPDRRVHLVDGRFFQPEHPVATLPAADGVEDFLGSDDSAEGAAHDVERRPLDFRL